MIGFKYVIFGNRMVLKLTLMILFTDDEGRECL
jgi:hypothetical protein